MNEILKYCDPSPGQLKIGHSFQTQIDFYPELQSPTLMISACNPIFNLYFYYICQPNYELKISNIQFSKMLREAIICQKCSFF